MKGGRNMKGFIKFTLQLLILIFLFENLMSSSLFGSSKRNQKNEFYPGDALVIDFIDVYKKSDRGSVNISGEYTIDSRGYIMLPLIGPFKVIGYNRYTLAEKLTEVYKPYFTEPYISIIPLIRLTIMGPFYKPGAYRVSPQSSLWELIEQAGGPRDNIDLNSIRVIRNDEVVVDNLLSSFEKGYSLEDIGVQSGDQIIAEVKKHFSVRQIFDYVRFGMNLVSLYILILRWEQYKK